MVGGESRVARRVIQLRVAVCCTPACGTSRLILHERLPDIDHILFCVCFSISCMSPSFRTILKFHKTANSPILFD